MQMSTMDSSSSSSRTTELATRLRPRKSKQQNAHDLIETINVCLRKSRWLGAMMLAIILIATSQRAAASSRSDLGRSISYELARLRPAPASGRQDLAAAGQPEEPMTLEADGERYSSPEREHSSSDENYALEAEPQADDHHDEAMENSNERSFLDNHQSHLRAMRHMFERRQLNQNQANDNERMHHTLGQASQELSPISIGLDPSSPFSMPPFAVGGDGGVQPAPPMMGPHSKVGPEQLEPAGAPGLGFGLNPLPHLLGFQNSAFDGPQRGDQSAHHAAASSQSQAEPELGPSQKVWPKIFRFTDGRINLSDFEIQKKINLEKQKKIAMQSGRLENHIESAPIMFDGRPLKRKSFLILHGGFFPRDR